MFSDARNIGNMAMEIYEEEEIDRVCIAYTKFITTISQEAKLLKLLPNDKLREGR